MLLGVALAMEFGLFGTKNLSEERELYDYIIQGAV